MPPSSPDDLHASLARPAGPAKPPPASAAPPLGVRPLVDRFGKPAGAGGEPVITPQPSQLVAPLRDSLRLDRLGRRVRLPLGGTLAKRA